MKQSRMAKLMIGLFSDCFRSGGNNMEYSYRETCLASRAEECFACHVDEDIVVHHIDGDRSNNELDNLIPLCRPCHSTLHSAKNLELDFLRSLREKLPESALTFGDQKNTYGSRNQPATETIPLTPETKQLIKERKKDGKTYDLWVRELMGVE